MEAISRTADRLTALRMFKVGYTVDSIDKRLNTDRSTGETRLREAVRGDYW
jgi:hypothetical protein